MKVIIISNTNTGIRGRTSFVLFVKRVIRFRKKDFVRRDIESRKCRCPFKFRGKPVVGEQDWMVKLMLICMPHTDQLHSYDSYEST